MRMSLRGALHLTKAATPSMRRSSTRRSGAEEARDGADIVAEGRDSVLHVSSLPCCGHSAVIEKVVDYIEAHHSTQIGLRYVAQAVGYSPSYLTDLFWRHTGLPVHALIIRRRIEAAQCLLRESNISIAAAAERVGFYNVCYCTRQFVRHVGVTPKHFRSVIACKPQDLTHECTMESRTRGTASL